MRMPTIAVLLFAGVFAAARADDTGIPSEPATTPPPDPAVGPKPSANASEREAAATDDEEVEACATVVREDVILGGTPIGTLHLTNGTFHPLWSRKCGRTDGPGVQVDGVSGSWTARSTDRDPTWLVIHETGSEHESYGPTKSDGSNAVHFFLGRNGDLYQVADLSKRFDHCDNDTIAARSIAIEMAAGRANKNPLTAPPPSGITSWPVNWNGTATWYYLPPTEAQMKVLQELVEFLDQHTRIPARWAENAVDPDLFAVVSNQSHCFPSAVIAASGGGERMGEVLRAGGIIHHGMIGGHSDGSGGALYTFLRHSGNDHDASYAWTECLLGVPTVGATAYPRVTGLDCEAASFRPPSEAFRFIPEDGPRSCHGLPPPTIVTTPVPGAGPATGRFAFGN